MAAYAALVSLSQTIHLILQNHHHSIFFHEFNQEIKHLLEQSSLLQAFLEDFPNGDDGLQARIRDVASKAEEVIQDFLSKQIESHLNSGLSEDVRLQRHRDNISCIDQKLQKVTKGIDSIVQKVMRSTNDISEGKDLQPTDSSSDSSSSGLPDGDEARIRDVGSEAEDVIQDFQSKQIQPHLTSAGPSQDVQPAKRYIWRQVNILGMCQKLRNVRKKVDSIVQQVMKSTKNSSKGKDLPPIDSSSASSSSSSSGLPAPGAGKDVVVGFEDDLMAIKHRLCGQLSKLQVVPILGMGGIGKTTLARNAFDDQLTVEHFQKSCLDNNITRL
ncbi:hypothetical protein Salat_1070400 [Sesamum alatum]|uniref:NB-ARC domain-containing protein n=1 Tax=Sesamum alatum TaxID=300844 RepID=A0AAE2CSP3_9LAMI|nr:hypothetical protein Salat_1070400 [Sesamum alatum]